MSLAMDSLVPIRRARDYSNHLLAKFDDDEWFQMPGGVSHIAWQVGHLAFAQYSLGLKRVRGPRPEDADLLPPVFIERFGRGSMPVGDPSAYPPITELRRVYEAVHAQLFREIPALDDAILDEPTDPHSRFTTKGESLTWCAEHEMLHAGQIGLLRRLLGKPPVW